MDAQNIVALLSADYALVPVAIVPLRPPTPKRVVYRIVLADGSSWRLEWRSASVAPPVWCNVATPQAWLERQAAALTLCATYGLSAPRVQPTLQGAVVVAMPLGAALLTEYVAGQPLVLEPSGVQQLGAVLGQLHQLPGTALPPSWWSPLAAISARALGWVTTARAQASGWVDLLDTCAEVLEEAQALPLLPQGLVHADCWADNVIAAASGGVQLIDWEFAGSGSVGLDLGSLLGDCYSVDAAGPQLRVDLLEAALAGYTAWRRLDLCELEHLPTLIQFGAAFRSGLRLFAAGAERLSESFARGMQCERDRLAVSGAIAAYAQQCLWQQR